MHMLIVEDDTWLAEIWRTHGETAGYSVVIARDGFAAIDACDEHIPDVILLDIVLPGPNGISFLHELRSHADFADIPVIVMTNLVSVTVKKMAPYGVTHVFQKDSLTPQQLKSAVRKVVA